MSHINSYSNFRTLREREKKTNDRLNNPYEFSTRGAGGSNLGKRYGINHHDDLIIEGVESDEDKESLAAKVPAGGAAVKTKRVVFPSERPLRVTER